MGKVLLDFPVLPSTNLFALDMLSEGRPDEGTVISARSQTEGRGQAGASWESEPGKNILLSVIF
ncbi:MAG TPA: biotin--[acetyl-CoA-carboxylase] ligase, partial [Saprospiraceae bacterium]|nr:biotin--[acetyl-CoA-carboxylase] ligase [Saprospiraceae bacterium]